ncbi:histidine kinase [Azorhizobium oxalatiphilum]|uniref:Histidine kinase n=1 Tax=Azorhizobium oxalatiphilum TaxID=980631 RepID=A0A917C4D9_9HYPH|nr:FecR family protein [Azorhizobium oxalatiphilum]GGF71808.1 histidine kinase [Azorhizobium oxalatiphilum]
MSDTEKADPLLEQAIDWMLYLTDAPGDADVLRRFEAWLAQSEAHARAWEKARRTWRAMGEVEPAHAGMWEQPSAAAQALATSSSRRVGDTRAAAGRPARRGRMAGAVAVAAIGLILFMAWPSLMLRLEADHRTATGESRSVTLADGSVITLGADSAIATDLAEGRRGVTLLAGEAFFEVARDASRPFVVRAGGVDVTVLGTAFDVSLSSAATEVELAHGVVSVSHTPSAAADGQTLAPGDTMVVDRNTGEMQRGKVAPDDIGAWRNGRIFVEEATIGSVVERLRRYHSAWISLPDATLANQKVTGLYDLRDPDRALRALVEPYGGHVREISPYLRLISRF